VTAAPLDDIRVLDFGRYVAAPYCSLMLADLGAEVLRVERPGGEADRRLGLRAAHGETFVFAGLARDKLGVTLDLRRGDTAREVLADLIAHCDVLVHNFAPPAAAAMGLAYEDVRAHREDIVYVAISSFGARGPDADRPGFDPIAQIGSGAAAVTGYEDGGALRAGVPWVDYSTGLAAAAGALAALRHRDRTGQGQAVECALLQTALSYTAPIVAEATVGCRERPRLGNQPAYIAISNLFACRDGEIYIVAVTPAAWRALARLIGHPELAEDPRLDSPEQRFEQRARIEPLVAAWSAGLDVAAAEAALRAARIPCGTLRRPADVAGDPQVAANGMLRFVDLEHEGLERVPASASPLALSALAERPAVRPPRPGEHNAQVYGSLLGYDPARLAALARDGVI
jgi:crotonobetainyl-CoA:carnitine CoA-transferase CaiB-like acyl-CoA transferase